MFDCSDGLSVGAFLNKLTSLRAEALALAIEGPWIPVRVILRALGRIYFCNSVPLGSVPDPLVRSLIVWLIVCSLR